MPIIHKDSIVARRDEAGKRILCKNCMNDRDFQHVARNDIVLRSKIEILYRKGNIIFCDNCDINIYRLIIESENKESQEASAPHLSGEEQEPEVAPAPHLPEEEKEPEVAPAPNLAEATEQEIDLDDLISEDLEVSPSTFDINEEENQKAS